MRPAITSRPEPPDAGARRRTLAVLLAEPSADHGDPQGLRVVAGEDVNTPPLVVASRVGASVGGI
ncbi:hypothetical protein IB243_22560 [Acidovorax sp. ACV01]|nr:hypothetical protein [Acidovorax sp. ACV01]